MRLDRDYLMEMELWSHFEMRSVATASVTLDVPAPVERAAEAVSLPPPSRASMTTAPRPTAAFTTPTTPTTPITSTTPARGAASGKPPPTQSRSAPIAPIEVQQTNVDGLDWDALESVIAQCTNCSLCKQRTKVVPGVGARDATWLFVGEGPGAEEDASGEPFVGAAGKLLDAMLASLGLQRGREVYIANVVKCRPPGNRTPLAEEAASCAPYLDRQIALIQPKIIVALGKTAVTRLTGSDAAMAAQRSREHRYQGIPVVATYHPAYLLRSLPEKLKAWEDLNFAKSVLAEAMAAK
jgi:uracil-DNA glycosylase